MRPEISQLIAPIYPTLTNAASVEGRPHIKGILKDVFFVEHSFREEKEKENTSKRNYHEANFVVALCNYLIQQGYKRDNITVLTTYVGQLLVLRQLFTRKRIAGVKISSVDNYQGEENDIVLLSLVRSNQQESIGFLKSSNRVCVALSRAKMGFYCIGNSKLLEDNSPLWNQVIDTLRRSSCIGGKLVLSCQKHPDTKLGACPLVAISMELRWT